MVSGIDKVSSAVEETETAKSHLEKLRDSDNPYANQLYSDLAKFHFEKAEEITSEQSDLMKKVKGMEHISGKITHRPTYCVGGVLSDSNAVLMIADREHLHIKLAMYHELILDSWKHASEAEPESMRAYLYRHTLQKMPSAGLLNGYFVETDNSVWGFHITDERGLSEDEVAKIAQKIKETYELDWVSVVREGGSEFIKDRTAAFVDELVDGNSEVLKGLLTQQNLQKYRRLARLKYGSGDLGNNALNSAQSAWLSEIEDLASKARLLRKVSQT